ncbi:MAG: LytTR family DNA-binding domain-containing protein [Lachnospiraceae bacterium]|nr:LytTR family DNA-binding domain-containing protein [Lachnospiraceae bacterium]
MLRIAVCDENKDFLNSFCRTFSRWIEDQYENIVLFPFTSGDDLLYEIGECGHFQIVFLEIEQKPIDGLYIAAQISKLCSETMIIFMSSLKHYSKRVFQVHPFYLFQKPIKYGELSNVMDDAVKRLETAKQNFHFIYDGFYYSVPIKEIIYFYSEGRKVGIVCMDKTFYYYEKLDLIEEKIKVMTEVFLRIHKSFMINKHYILVYRHDSVEMNGNANLPVSKSKRKFVKDILCKDWL